MNQIGNQIKYWYRKDVPEIITITIRRLIPFWVQIRYFNILTKNFDFDVQGHGEAKKLLEIYPDEKEGILDKKFASLVNKKTCLQIAKNINLDKYILTFNPKNKTVKIEDKVIADACEALIGAVYLDKGFNNVEIFILNLWKKDIEESIITQLDAKTKLQEFSLKKYKKLPTYKIISNTGPRHKPILKVGVKLPDSKYYIAEGSSKKIAEQNAAILCLNNIK